MELRTKEDGLLEGRLGLLVSEDLAQSETGMEKMPYGLKVTETQYAGLLLLGETSFTGPTSIRYWM